MLKDTLNKLAHILECTMKQIKKYI
jgi:hypothetical protein